VGVRVGVVLTVIALAVLGAFLHPLAFLLGLIPFDTKGLIGVLNELKALIADLLAWGLVSLLVVMLLLVYRGRRGARKAVERRFFETGTRRPRGIAVGIVAYNEAEAIADVVREFGAQANVVEVIVVDNNSRDATAAIARSAGARVVSEPRQGYGYACIRGLQEGLTVVDADVIVLTEGDGTFAATDLPKFEAYIDQADMVIGTRVVPGLVEDGSQMDYFFTWGNIAVGSLLRMRFWQSKFLGAARLSDVGCTYRMINRKALESILPDLMVGGNHFSPHMMLVALYRRLSLVEIPISFRQRIGSSKGAGQSLWMGLKVGLRMIAHIVFHRPKRLVRPNASVSVREAIEVGEP
jgi:hypothetical protein